MMQPAPTAREAEVMAVAAWFVMGLLLGAIACTAWHHRR